MRRLFKVIIIVIGVFLAVNFVFAAPRKATLIQPFIGKKVVVVVGSNLSKWYNLGYVLMTSNNLFLGSYAPTTGYSERLTQSITNSATTVYVSSVLDRDGNALPLSNTNKGYFTIESGVSSREEAIVCTGVSTSSITLTGCTRGLLATGSDETGSITRAYAHNAGSRIIMTNIGQFYGNYVDIWNAQTIAGVKNFSSLPTSTTTAPTANNQLATKKYADDLAIAGAPDGSETVKGIWEGATRDEMSIGTNLGGTGAGLLLQNRYATSTPSATTTIPITGTNGKLSDNFTDFTLNKTFSGNNVHSGTNSFSATTTFTGPLNATSTTNLSGTNTLGTTTFSNANVGINGLSYSWPSTQATNTPFLKNNGSGTLTWGGTWNNVAGTQVLTSGTQTSYTDVNLSSIVGPNYALVFLIATLNDSGAGAASANVRRNGDGTTYTFENAGGTSSGLSSLACVASCNAGVTYPLMVSTDSSGIIEYTTGGADDVLNLYVLGYLK